MKSDQMRKQIAAFDYGTQLTDSQAYKDSACCKMQQAKCLSS
jgi:hypothetical protein